MPTECSSAQTAVYRSRRKVRGKDFYGLGLVDFLLCCTHLKSIRDMETSLSIQLHVRTLYAIDNVSNHRSGLKISMNEKAIRVSRHLTRKLLWFPIITIKSTIRLRHGPPKRNQSGAVILQAGHIFCLFARHGCQIAPHEAAPPRL